MVIPCDPSARITQYFGENPQWYKRFNLPGHNGLDYGVTCGSMVYAYQKGTIIWTGLDTAGYGLYIKVRHDQNHISLYAHLSKLNCFIGQKIEEGQVIGLSGYSGYVIPAGEAGAHLHFELRENNKAVDPYPVLYTDGWTERSSIAPPVGAQGLRPATAETNTGLVIDTFEIEPPITSRAKPYTTFVRHDPTKTKKSSKSGKSR